MRRPLHLCLPAVALALALTLLSPPATGSAPDDRRGPVLDRIHAYDMRGSAVPTGPFLGTDGATYDIAPLVVRGEAGQYYVGQDFDTACENGPRFKRGLERLARLAATIEATGRRVVFSVAPNKSAIDEVDLPADVPHGRCTLRGLAAQNRQLDTFRDPNYLYVREHIAKSRVQPYWRTDAHWSTVGASIYAQRLARRLSPRLARQQQYADTERVELGDLFEYLLTPIPERAPARLPANGVTVTEAPDSAGGFDPVVPLTFDHSWDARPARKTFPGQTLLVGDSFTYVGLEPLRSLFRHGRFVWIQDATLPLIVQAMKEADTVVLEVVQRFVSRSAIGTVRFRKQVARALARYDRKQGR